MNKRLELLGTMNMKKKLPDKDADGELDGNELLMAEQVAAARPGGAIQMNDVIERISAHDNLERPVSRPVQNPAPPTPQRTGQSKLNANALPFCRRMDSSD